MEQRICFCYKSRYDHHHIVSYFRPCKLEKASIEDIRALAEIWEGKLAVQEGLYQYHEGKKDYCKLRNDNMFAFEEDAI